MILDDAGNRAMNDAGAWTPAQLGTSIKGNTTALGGRGLRANSNSPLYQLQQDMQAVLPNKIPPTGVNAAPALALAGLASGASGEATDNNYLRLGGLAALLASPYTKTGQKALQALLLGERSPATLAIGKQIRERKGLLGSGLAPLGIQFGGGN
jgi:hypothetical protein